MTGVYRCSSARLSDLVAAPTAPMAAGCDDPGGKHVRHRQLAIASYPPATTSGRAVDHRLEGVIERQRFLVRERQHLAYVYAANPSRRIDPEICIRQARPHEAAGWAAGRRLLGIDLKA